MDTTGQDGSGTKTQRHAALCLEGRCHPRSCVAVWLVCRVPFSSVTASSRDTTLPGQCSFGAGYEVTVDSHREFLVTATGSNLHEMSKL
ncbi:hypothetical protein E2C01_070784 [Portunus trituberculatus]|uniref:Uncharacterized protein n=1 Tax=Portunus trituberculatus TaxID=210409 RepID=A0A5B7I6D6_PORTR|nr:hypothetical protein [Portunus trituberculatus]